MAILRERPLFNKSVVLKHKEKTNVGGRILKVRKINNIMPFDSV